MSLRTKDVRSAQPRYLKVHETIERWLQSLGAPDAVPEATVSGLPDLKRYVTPPAPATTFRDHSAPLAALVVPATSYAHQPFRLSDCLEVYLAEKKHEFAAYRGRALQIRLNEKRRVIRYLMEALGEDREVASLTRNDARHFRDFLMSKGLAIGSGRKNLKIAAAIIECGLADRQIAMRNPFRGLHMTDEIAAIDARLPLSQEEIAIARSMSVNAELSTIVELLVLTGARLNEIAGLEWNDVDLASDAGISSITIRMNGIRRLKTANSKRKVPLVEEAKDALLKLRTALITQDARGAVFPRYGRPGGSDAASAALMKALRKAGVHDRRKSIHSIRHSVKQALRDAGCPKDISDAIQGHLSNDISNTYGIGHSMVHMLSWISKITTNSKDTS